MLCTGLFPNADTKIQHRRRPTCPLWYDKYQLCSIGSIMYTFARKRMQQITQVAQSAYSSGSIRLLKWLNQFTQVAQSDYSSGSISESSRLRKRVQPSA